MKKFFGRHPKSSLGRAAKNEYNRFRHCNAEALTIHIAAIIDLIEKHNLPPSKYWNISNLDEAGCTPGKYVKGSSNRKQ